MIPMDGIKFLWDESLVHLMDKINSEIIELAPQLKAADDLVAVLLGKEPKNWMNRF